MHSDGVRAFFKLPGNWSVGVRGKEGGEQRKWGSEERMGFVELIIFNHQCHTNSLTLKFRGTVFFGGFGLCFAVLRCPIIPA